MFLCSFPSILLLFSSSLASPSSSVDYSCLHSSSWILSSTSSISSLSDSSSVVLKSFKDDKQWSILSKDNFQSFQLQPALELHSTGCFQSSSQPIGMFVNGAPIFSFLSNKHSQIHTKTKYWLPIQSVSSVIDDCSGVKDSKNLYGHFSFPSCLSSLLNETQTSHSSIFGWSYDNYPIYGPYQSNSLLAQSSWFLRDYSSTSQTGCQSESERNCVFKNNLNVEEGVIYLKSSESGPSIDIFPSGSFFEDYYFNQSHYLLNQRSVHEEYLDQFNGHSHAPHGYHYHITVDQQMKPIFPFIIGPKYFGCQMKSERQCCSSIYSSTSASCAEVSEMNSICGIPEGSIQMECSESSSSSSSSLDPRRHLDSTELSTPVWTHTPTVVPTSFSSPTFKPSIEFLSHQPTILTSSPTVAPSSHSVAVKGSRETSLTTKNILLVVLIVVGGVIVIAGIGILVYWKMFTRTGEEYQDASSSTYVEKMKDFTSGISLVDR